MIVFSADPGSVNFAYTIQNIVEAQGQIRVKFLGSGMLKAPVKDLTQDQAMIQLRHFAKQLRRIRKKYNPDVVCMERFQSRGNGGATIEHINMMLGLVPIVFKDAHVEFPTAAMWKNRTKPFFDLKAAYKGYGLTSKAKAYTGITEHQLDSALIGTWIGHKVLDVDMFSLFNRISLDDYVDAMQNTKKLSY